MLHEENKRTMKTLSIGKIRGLQQCSTADGKFAILALDHRNNMRRLLHPESEDLTTAIEIIEFKYQVVSALRNIPSAYLLDPLFGAAQCISSGILPGGGGLLVALEATGYTGDQVARQSKILSNWSVNKIKRMGANGVKLLVYYHPEAKTHHDIESLVGKVAEDCIEADIPFFLEILTYSLDPNSSTLMNDERYEVIIESAKRLTALGPDVLKAEFPMDVQQEDDQEKWQKACEGLTQASQVPWILLSASVDFEMFLRQVEIACRANASGVAVGRAVWKEATDLRDVERLHFLQSTARARMQRINQIVVDQAKPWASYFDPVCANECWYKNYPGS